MNENKFSDLSDIDIAVEGLEEDFFQIFCELEELLGRHIDLIEIERCYFKKRIEKEGIRIK